MSLFTASVPDGAGSIWLDDVQCTGSETSIVSCPSRGLGNHNCVHFEDIGVSCPGGKNGSIQNLNLRGAPNGTVNFSRKVMPLVTKHVLELI